MSDRPTDEAMARRIEGLERRLTESEGRLEVLGKVAYDLIYEWTVATDHLEWFGNIDEVLGYGREEIPRTLAGWVRIIHPEDRERLEDAVERHRTSKEPILYEYRVRRKDGSWRFWSDKGLPLLDSDGRPYKWIGVCTDVTGQRRAEERLVESEKKYRDFVDSLPQVVFETDAQGNIVFANEWAFEVFGYDRQEMEQGLKALDMLHPDDRERAGRNMEKVLGGEVPGAVEYRALKKDGRVFPVMIHSNRILSSGRPVGLRGVITDITERKKTEEALRASEELYRILFQQARDVIYFTTPEGRLIDMNDAGLELLGYPREEFKRIDVTDHHTNAEQREEENRELLEKGFIKDREIALIKKDGTRITCLDSATVLRNPDGSVKGYIGTLRDITEKKRVEAEKARLEEELQRARKLEAVGTLAGGIAHDFNNLLTGIRGNTSLALQELQPEHPLYERLASIEQYAQRGADLTHQLLGFARGGKYEVRPADMNEVIQRTSDMFGRTKKEIRIHTDFQEGLWTVEVDRGQIEQVLLNLYVNAWQSMQAGGDLRLKTENVRLGEEDVKPLGTEPGRFVKISVADTGIGMDEATRQRIFEPFFTTKERGRGTGLGLASVYGIITNHGGIIRVRSRENEGTVFTIYLRAGHRVVPDEAAPESRVVKGSETVLLVDDEDMIIEVGSEMLSRLGYTVLTAKGGGEALETYRRHEGIIDLVLLDMIMPGMSGEEVYNQLLAMNPEVRVLLSSGYSMESRASRLLDRGCVGFVQKPFDLETFSRKLRAAFER